MAEAVSLGKGAWDCDANREIPPEKEAEVFEEIATMDFPFEGIPTVPPRKDMDHMVFFCGGCRYRVTAYRDWPVYKVKQALFAGGIARANKPEGVRNTPGIRGWEDLTLIYAGQHMENDKPLMGYHVPPVRSQSTSYAKELKEHEIEAVTQLISCAQGCQTMIAIETAKLVLGKPDPDSAYWN